MSSAAKITGCPDSDEKVTPGVASDEKSGHGRYLTRMSDRGPTGRAYGQGLRAV